MFVMCVDVRVKPEKVDDFVRATEENHRQTRLEPGNLRFDVVQAEDDPGRFMLYEVYREPSDFEAHQRTEHYLRWRDAVKDWMATPRQGVRYRSVFPTDEADWSAAR
jgi:autoinducer 2-degrading protein